MAGSLQDQLLKAGLTDKAKVKKAKKDRHKQVKAKQKHKIETVNESKVTAQAAMAEKKAKDQALNAEAKALAEQKAIAAQVKQLIALNKQSRGKDEVACNFTDGTLIKRIYVSQQVQRHISQGKLAIVKLGAAYELVPMPVADKIVQRDEASVVYRADIKDNKPEQTSEEDDWYADYQIPDDLSW